MSDFDICYLSGKLNSSYITFQSHYINVNIRYSHKKKQSYCITSHNTTITLRYRYMTVIKLKLRTYAEIPLVSGSHKYILVLDSFVNY